MEEGKNVCDTNMACQNGLYTLTLFPNVLIVSRYTLFLPLCHEDCPYLCGLACLCPSFHSLSHACSGEIEAVVSYFPSPDM